MAAVLGRSAIEGRYWAGLWEKNLPLFLMWRLTTADSPNSSGLVHSTLVPRPVEYQGPSWSWVSVNTIAHYTVHRGVAIHVVEVLGCDIKLADDSAVYGAVETAQLHLRGRTRPGLLHYNPGPLHMNKKRWELDAGLATGSVYARGDALEPEFASPTLSPIRVHLLEVMRRVHVFSDEAGGAISEGLILRHLPSQQYTRLGTFAFHTAAIAGLKTPQNIWFDGYDEEILCLV